MSRYRSQLGLALLAGLGMFAGVGLVGSSSPLDAAFAGEAPLVFLSEGCGYCRQLLDDHAKQGGGMFVPVPIGWEAASWRDEQCHTFGESLQGIAALVWAISPRRSSCDRLINEAQAWLATNGEATPTWVRKGEKVAVGYEQAALDAAGVPMRKPEEG